MPQRRILQTNLEMGRSDIKDTKSWTKNSDFVTFRDARVPRRKPSSLNMYNIEQLSHDT